MCASCHTARRHARTTTAQQKEDGLSSSRRSHKPEELGLYAEVSRAPLKGFFFYWSVAWLDFSFRKIMAAGWRMIWGHVDIDREGSKDIAKKKLMDSTKKKKPKTKPSPVGSCWRISRIAWSDLCLKTVWLLGWIYTGSGKGPALVIIETRDYQGFDQGGSSGLWEVVKFCLDFEGSANRISWQTRCEVWEKEKSGVIPGLLSLSNRKVDLPSTEMEKREKGVRFTGEVLDVLIYPSGDLM